MQEKTNQKFMRLYDIKKYQCTIWNWFKIYRKYKLTDHWQYIPKNFFKNFDKNSVSLVYLEFLFFYFRGHMINWRWKKSETCSKRAGFPSLFGSQQIISIYDLDTNLLGHKWLAQRPGSEKRQLFYITEIKLYFYLCLIKFYFYSFLIKLYFYLFLIKLYFKFTESAFLLFLIKLYSFKNQFLLFM